jgi:hypothetical protein
MVRSSFVHATGVAEAVGGEVARGDALGEGGCAGLAGVSTRLGTAVGGVLGTGPGQAAAGISAENSRMARQMALTRFPDIAEGRAQARPP